MRFSDRVKALNIPLDQVVVIGSGLLDQLGLRTAHDVDLAVSPQILTAAKSSGEYECGVKGADRYCRKKGLELWSNWGEELPYDALVSKAIVDDGVRFVAPNTLIAKKRQRGTTKDLSDIALLEEHYAAR